MALQDFVETDILLTLDSGCCDLIVDMADAPGYAAVLYLSPGPQRNQQFIKAQRGLESWGQGIRKHCISTF